MEFLSFLLIAALGGVLGVIGGFFGDLIAALAALFV
jgi:hypothetical protein